MTVYILSGAHTNAAPNIGVPIAPGLARGLKARGIETKIAWAGHPRHELGVEHIPHWTPYETASEDFLLVADPNTLNVLKQHPWNDLQRKGLFTSSDHPGKDFSQFDLILAENQHDLLKTKYPKARVFDFLMGCEEKIEVSPNSLFNGPRTVFFCGRLGEYPPSHNVRLDWLRDLARRLPGHHFIFLANSIVLPYELTPDDLKGHVMLPFDSSSPELMGGGLASGVWKPEGGGSLRSTFSQGSVNYVCLPSDEAVKIVNHAIGTDNLSYWGVRNWGTFWEMYRHAHCVLDFGFPSIPSGPNTKIIDPLRAGARIVAAGCSSTFHLLPKWGGTVVPYGDMDAMARAILEVPEEPVEVKAARGKAFAAEHSWTVKMGRVIDSLDAGFFGGRT